MVKQNLLFQALSLLSQYLTQIKEAKGPLYQKTACLNAEEREAIGLLEGSKVFVKEDKETIELFDEMEDFLECVGIARWPRTELTDLGLRVGQRHKVQIDLSSDIISDLDIAEDEASEE